MSWEMFPGAFRSSTCYTETSKDDASTRAVEATSGLCSVYPALLLNSRVSTFGSTTTGLFAFSKQVSSQTWGGSWSAPR